MSLALSRAARLKPEVRLAQAVSQFEADLSVEQKATFRTYRSQALENPPNPSDVMRFTAEFDRTGSGNARGLRCYGPRLTNVLQAVQQFAALGDIIIGGSQNIIACGIWALVRLSLLSMVNFASYLEKLSFLLMKVGRCAPRYQNMAMLYPRSKDLQAYLSEYFIVITQLCRQMLKYTRKSIFGQLTSSLMEADLKQFQSDLDSWSMSIKEEVTLLMGKAMHDECHENSTFRSIWNTASQLTSYRRQLERRQQVLDACSLYDYETTWKQIRKSGTTTLFRQFPEYIQWKTQTTSSALVLEGKLGSGKSVLLANMVDDLNLSTVGRQSSVVYFFCRHDIAESLKAATIMGSLVRQILIAATGTDSFQDVYHKDTIAVDFIRVVKQFVSSNHKGYIILDGLDECPASERETLLHQLKDLQETFVSRLCISIRSRSDIEYTKRLGAFQMSIMPEDNPEIESFITAELERVTASQKLTLGDPALKLEIQHALATGAQGMFLWVALQIELLCLEQTDAAIRCALSDLPKDLSDTFQRILRRSEKLVKTDQIRVLELILAARHPLSTEQLREALSVVPGDTTWRQDNLINNIITTLKSCGSLVIIDEEESTVRFVHHSVSHFLITSFKNSVGQNCTSRSANRTMAQVIITYMNYGVFDRKVSTFVVPSLQAGSAPSQIIESTLGRKFSRPTLNTALKLMKVSTRQNVDVGKILTDAGGLAPSSVAGEFFFHPYAKSFWLYHAGFLSDFDEGLFNLLSNLSIANLQAEGLTDKHGRTGLSYAAEAGNSKLVGILIDMGAIQTEDGSPKPSSWYAAANGHLDIVEQLLDNHAIATFFHYGPPSQKVYFGQKPPAYLLYPSRSAENETRVPAKLLFDLCYHHLPLGGNSPSPDWPLWPESPQFYTVNESSQIHAREQNPHMSRHVRTIVTLDDLFADKDTFDILPDTDCRIFMALSLLEADHDFHCNTLRPWIGFSWTRKDIAFFRSTSCSPDVILQRVCLSRDLSPASTSGEGPSLFFYLSLCKLLLELCLWRAVKREELLLHNNQNIMREIGRVFSHDTETFSVVQRFATQVWAWTGRQSEDKSVFGDDESVAKSFRDDVLVSLHLGLSLSSRTFITNKYTVLNLYQFLHAVRRKETPPDIAERMRLAIAQISDETT